MKYFATPKNRKLISITSTFFRVLLILSTSLAFASTRVHAIEMEAGVGALEEGDDRGRGAAIVHLGFNGDWVGRFYLWGRNYGPVNETSGIISFSKQTSVFGSKALSASIGGSAMAEQTVLSYKDAPGENSDYTSTNVGLALGLRYKIISGKTFSLSASWDSHIFAASEAVILLVTGRKQIIGLTAGVAL